MKRLPVAATLLTLIMLPILVGLGVWQLERRTWKEGVIAAAHSAERQPPLAGRDLADALASGAPLSFRRAVLACRPGPARPAGIRGGESAAGDAGYFVLFDCADPSAPGVVAVAGWTQLPMANALVLPARLAGRLVARSDAASPAASAYLLVAQDPVPPLAAPRLPSGEDLPNNHLAYAIQWFAFALTLAVVYLVFLLRWRRDRAP